MNAMRLAALFFVALLCILPAALFAAEKFDPKAYNGSDDQCLDEKIVITNGKVGTQKGRTDTERYKTCKNISGGCSLAKEKLQPPECICGKLYYPRKGKSPVPLDKCDPDIKKKLAKAMAGGIEGMAAFATQERIAERIGEIDASTADGRGKLSQILQSYGVTKAEADAKVNDTDKAADVQAQLQKFVGTSDTAEAKKVADDLGLKLNENLTDAVRLDPKKYEAIFSKEELEREQIVVPTTFQEVVRGVVAGTLAPLCGNLGGCSDVACQSNPGSLTCRTNNPGALTWAPWEAKYGGQPCGERNNTACFPSLEHGLAAKIDLITGSKYLGGSNNTILSMLCNGYAPNSDGNNCGSYATFVQNQTGIPMNQTIDPKNPEQIGKIAMAMARMENGKFVPFTPQQLENAMAMVYGGTLPNGTPGFIPQTAYGTNNGNGFNSPFNFSSPPSPTNVGYGSPFAGTSQAPVAQASYSQPQPTQAATPVSQTIAQPTSITQTQTTTSGTSSVAQKLQLALQDGTGTTGQSPATVIAEPKDVTRGNPITVAWTSVGMSADTPCTLRANSTFIAEGNQGSRVVPTTAATRVGSLIFTLSCTTASGTKYQRTAAVMVR